MQGQVHQWFYQGNKGTKGYRGSYPLSAGASYPGARQPKSNITDKKSKRKQRLYFDWSPCANIACKINHSMSSTVYNKLSQELPHRQASVCMQLRTGHIGLNKHLHRIGKAESPYCPVCKKVEETVQHYLFGCPAYCHDPFILASIPSFTIPSLCSPHSPILWICQKGYSCLVSFTYHHTIKHDQQCLASVMIHHYYHSWSCLSVSMASIHPQAPLAIYSAGLSLWTWDPCRIRYMQVPRHVFLLMTLHGLTSLLFHVCMST